MKFLLINSNSESAFVALTKDNEHFISYASQFITEKEKHQSDVLVRCLYEVRQHTDSLDDIDAVSVIVGPGAFTGMRVGISIAKGIAFASQKKIIPINNFGLEMNKIEHLDKENKYVVLIPSKFPEFYFSFRKASHEFEQGCIKLDELYSKYDNATVIVGNFSDETLANLGYFEIINTRNYSSEFDSMLKLSLQKFNEGKLFKSSDIDVLYIKDFVIKTSKQI